MKRLFLLILFVYTIPTLAYTDQPGRSFSMKEVKPVEAEKRTGLSPNKDLLYRPDQKAAQTRGRVAQASAQPQEQGHSKLSVEGLSRYFDLNSSQATRIRKINAKHELEEEIRREKVIAKSYTIKEEINLEFEKSSPDFERIKDLMIVQLKLQVDMSLRQIKRAYDIRETLTEIQKDQFNVLFMNKKVQRTNV